ncbi:Uncharacterised protein [Mycoplasmopsis edwardii]|uniref:Uncharacterized protein n=1 Tax=Mycoplasmopsis edwardii TaxID=53558 RepID=A0A3B0PP53_9BACT|nr:Uncharacterised protein [Mycoplasmopsis edwardii]
MLVISLLSSLRALKKLIVLLYPLMFAASIVMIVPSFRFPSSLLSLVIFSILIPSEFPTLYFAYSSELVTFVFVHPG